MVKFAAGVLPEPAHHVLRFSQTPFKSFHRILLTSRTPDKSWQGGHCRERYPAFRHQVILTIVSRNHSDMITPAPGGCGYLPEQYRPDAGKHNIASSPISREGYGYTSHNGSCKFVMPPLLAAVEGNPEKTEPKGNCRHKIAQIAADILPGTCGTATFNIQYP